MRNQGTRVAKMAEGGAMGYVVTVAAEDAELLREMLREGQRADRELIRDAARFEVNIGEVSRAWDRLAVIDRLTPQLGSSLDGPGFAQARERWAAA
jgi:hypothetical protein